METNNLIEHACTIGHRIVDEAMHSGDRCTWLVTIYDPTQGSRGSRSAPASFSLYQGTAGIGLFLCELWRLTGDPVFSSTASAAIRFAADPSKLIRAGLYSGASGVAVAAARIAEILKDDEISALAISSAESSIRCGIRDDDDIISGVAGEIVALLNVRRIFPDDRLIDTAEALGHQLVERARRTPSGWSWRILPDCATQDLTGYAHGASGCAHAFLELYAVTGDNQWSYAASRAMAYERSREIQSSGLWPDYRSLSTARALREGTQALRIGLRDGSIGINGKSPGAPVAWCHGSAGIALTRIRALMLDVDSAVVADELNRALQKVRDSLTQLPPFSHSLCHGTLGNIESVLLAKQYFGIPDDDSIEKSLHYLLNRDEPSPLTWRTGVIGGGYDPSLLVGVAGIGHQLLRIADNSVPSVLCISDWNSGKQSGIRRDNLAAKDLERLFPNLGETMPAIRKESLLTASISEDEVRYGDLNSAFRSAGTWIRSTSQSTDVLIALEIDEIREEMQSAFGDYVEQQHIQVLQPASEEIDLTTTRFMISPTSQVTWLPSRLDAALNQEEHTEQVPVLFFRRDDSIHTKQLDEIHSFILDQLQTPQGYEVLLTRVRDSVDADEETHEALPAFVASFLINGFQSGFLHASNPA